MHVSEGSITLAIPDGSMLKGASLVAQMGKNLPAVQEMEVQSLGQDNPLEEGMATHSSILAWRIPCTEEPGGLQSTGWQRVGRDWVTNTFSFTSYVEKWDKTNEQKPGRKYSAHWWSSRLCLDWFFSSLHKSVMEKHHVCKVKLCLLGALVVKNSPVNRGDIRDVGSIPGSGRSPGGGHGNPLQCSCLENPMERGAWWVTVHGVAKGWTWLKWLSTHTLL